MELQFSPERQVQTFAIAIEACSVYCCRDAKELAPVSKSSGMKLSGGDMSATRYCHICLVLLVCLSFSSLLLGQTSATGGLTGTVTDPSDAIVQNATVTLTNPSTGIGERDGGILNNRVARVGDCPCEATSSRCLAKQQRTERQANKQD